MMLATTTPQDCLDRALDALRTNGETLQPALDELPVPVYVTDAEGLVTHGNRACVELTGRQPEPGKDRWCVTWQLHTIADEDLPHDRCPMAAAIKEKREIRGEIAIAMRPDGGRRAFVPYPTPLFDEQGELTGAVNMLVDVSKEQAEVLSQQAERCHRLAAAISDRHTCELLRGMAWGYERNATALRKA